MGISWQLRMRGSFVSSGARGIASSDACRIGACAQLVDGCLGFDARGWPASALVERCSGTHRGQLERGVPNGGASGVRPRPSSPAGRGKPGDARGTPARTAARRRWYRRRAFFSRARARARGAIRAAIAPLGEVCARARQWASAPSPTGRALGLARDLHGGRALGARAAGGATQARAKSDPNGCGRAAGIGQGSRLLVARCPRRSGAAMLQKAPRAGGGPNAARGKKLVGLRGR